MADLVLSDEVLEFLKTVLSGALKNLEFVQRSLGNLDPAPLGADAVLRANVEYVAARESDLSTAGTGTDKLKSQVDKVGQKIADTDRRLGADASR